MGGGLRMVASSTLLVLRKCSFWAAIRTPRDFCYAKHAYSAEPKQHSDVIVVSLLLILKHTVTLFLSNLTACQGFHNILKNR